jgi:1-acyl-sn-glycerol-3-phosphate acyltransferase
MIGKVLLAATRFLVGGHARWQGCAPSPAQRIYFANHSSHLDTVILWAALPEDLRATTHPVAAADYWGKGRVRRHIATKVLNAVLVDRAARHDPLASLREALDRGHSLILFPEGTRTADRLPQPFRGGLFRIAESFPALNLVPAYLDTLHRSLPKGSHIPLPLYCTVRFGAALERPAAETRAEFLHRAHASVCALADPARRSAA